MVRSRRCRSTCSARCRRSSSRRIGGRARWSSCASSISSRSTSSFAIAARQDSRDDRQGTGARRRDPVGRGPGLCRAAIDRRGAMAADGRGDAVAVHRRGAAAARADRVGSHVRVRPHRSSAICDRAVPIGSRARLGCASRVAMIAAALADVQPRDRRLRRRGADCRRGRRSRHGRDCRRLAIAARRDHRPRAECRRDRLRSSRCRTAMSVTPTHRTYHYARRSARDANRRRHRDLQRDELCADQTDRVAHVRRTSHRRHRPRSLSFGHDARLRGGIAAAAL